VSYALAFVPPYAALFDLRGAQALVGRLGRAYSREPLR
jgi:hypothetical protein